MFDEELITHVFYPQVNIVLVVDSGATCGSHLNILKVFENDF